MPSATARVDSGIILGDDPVPTTDYQQEQQESEAADAEQPMEALVSRQDDATASEATTQESWAGDERGNRSSSQVGPVEDNNDDGVNKDFQDVRATGKWGRITRTEKLLFAGVVVAVIVAIVVVAVVITGKDDGGGDSNDSPSALSEPTESPTMAPTFPPFSQEEQLITIMAMIGNLTSTQQSLGYLPADQEYYKGLHNDESHPYQVRAMSWILHEDPRKERPTSPWLVPRFGLAALYYATNGKEWTNNTAWLTGDHACDWFGIMCDRATRSTLEQLDLQSNNLTNEIPNEVALLSDVRSLWFRRNRLTGEIPAKAFNDMKKLQDLHLDSNQLTGKIPAILAESVPPLSTLFLQENQFNGIFPMEFCSGPLESPILDNFGVDCERNGCVCCNREDNCF